MYLFLHRKQREFWWSQPYQPYKHLRSTICEYADTSNPAFASWGSQLRLFQDWLPAQGRIFKRPHAPYGLLAAIWNPTINIHSLGFRRLFSFQFGKVQMSLCCHTFWVHCPAWSPLRCLWLVHALHIYWQARLRGGIVRVPLTNKRGAELLFNECSLFTTQYFQMAMGQQWHPRWQTLVNDLLP